MTSLRTFDHLLMAAGLRLNEVGTPNYRIDHPLMDTGLGRGQADGGAEAGRYLELGVGPGYVFPKAWVTVPVKVGISLADYYELNTGTSEAPVFEDHKCGYFSIAGVVTVPLGGTTSFDAWNVHGSVEFQALGDTTKAFNGGDGSRVIGSIGIGFTY